MLKEILKDLQRQINKMKVKGITRLDEANYEDLRNYITLFKKLDVAKFYEKEILNIKRKYEDFLEPEKTMSDWYDKQIRELEAEFDRSFGEDLFYSQSEIKIKNQKAFSSQEKPYNVQYSDEEKNRLKARDYVLVSLRDSERQVWELYTDGKTVQNIANQLGKHKQSISATIINIKNKISRKQNMLTNNQ
jgi:DNA-binding CsgD family transcriptional regulator